MSHCYYCRCAVVALENFDDDFVAAAVVVAERRRKKS